MFNKEQRDLIQLAERLEVHVFQRNIGTSYPFFISSVDHSDFNNYVLLEECDEEGVDNWPEVDMIEWGRLKVDVEQVINQNLFYKKVNLP